MSLMNKLSRLAKSPQGKDLVDKAKTFANDPKTREKIDEARDKFSGHVETAKQKMAEKKAKDGSSAGNGSPQYGEPTAGAETPQYGEPDTSHAEPATGASGAAETATYGEPGPADTPTYGEEGAAGTPPTSPQEDPIDKTNPTYGEEEGDKPLYGDDGPKAA